MSQAVLDLDLGNTRIKWRYTAADGVVAEGAFAHAECRMNEFPADSPGRIRVATVVQGECLEALLAVCRERWVEPEIARVTAHCAGVSQGYTDQINLGVDRWLAMLAAHHSTRLSTSEGCVVVSCGTAVTVDLVASAGEHQGGYIVPGLTMMRSALFAGTSGVRLEKIEIPDTLAPGRGTVPAVNRGLMLMIKGLVENAVSALQARGDVQILVTGGDGELILPFLNPPFASTKASYHPNLVLDGLALALP
jgi:type III pantothenate kinase